MRRDRIFGIRRRDSALRRGWRDERGTSTIEFVLWFPLFIAVFGLMVDASLVFSGQSQVLRVIQDANRNASIGRLKTDAEVKDWIETQLNPLTPNAVASSSVTAGLVTTTVTFPARDVQAVGWFSSLLNLNIVVTAEHLVEDFGT